MLFFACCSLQGDIHLQIADLFEDVLSKGIQRATDTVIGPASLSGHFEKSCIFQDLEVSRDPGLYHLKGLFDITDTDSTLCVNETENFDACFVIDGTYGFEKKFHTIPLRAVYLMYAYISRYIDEFELLYPAHLLFDMVFPLGGTAPVRMCFVVYQTDRLSGSGVFGTSVRTVVLIDTTYQICGDTGVEGIICTADDIDEIGHG